MCSSDLLLLLKSSEELSAALDVSAENLNQMKEQAGQISEETLIRYIHIFSELSGQMKRSSQKRILFEVALIKLCRPQMESDYNSLIGRIEQLEKKIESGIVTAPLERQALSTPKKTNEQSMPQPLPKAVPEDIRQAVQNWNHIKAAMPDLSKKYLSKAKLAMGNGNELVLVFDDFMAAGYFNQPIERKQLEDAITEQIGKEVTVSVKEKDANEPFAFPHH